MTESVDKLWTCNRTKNMSKVSSHLILSLRICLEHTRTFPTELFLMKLLLTMKNLTMIFLPIPRAAALLLVLPPVSIYLDLRRFSPVELQAWNQNVLYDIELVQPITANGHDDVCHKIALVITPIFKSTPNLKTRPLCQSCQLASCYIPKNDQSRINKFKRELFFKTSMNLAILPLLTIVLSIL